MGKVFENLIRSRIRTEIDIPLSSNQFGFKPGVSTIDAVAKVIAKDGEGELPKGSVSNERSMISSSSPSFIETCAAEFQ